MEPCRIKCVDFYTTQASVSPGFTLVQDSGTIASLNAATGKAYAGKFTVVTERIAIISGISRVMIPKNGILIIPRLRFGIAVHLL